MGVLRELTRPQADLQALQNALDCSLLDFESDLFFGGLQSDGFHAFDCDGYTHGAAAEQRPATTNALVYQPSAEVHHD
jgi:hypothetical protein